MKCYLIMTGNELMTGVTTDTNSSYMAQALLEIGITVEKKITVGDNLKYLIDTMRLASENADILIINGGLGPTIDDMTAEALAQVCEIELQYHPSAEQHIRQWCQERGLAANPANLKQALLPITATIIPNPIGSAVGFYMTHQDCLIMATPGVPSEMRLMLQEQVLPLIQSQYPEFEKRLIKRLQVFGFGESSIQQLVSNQLADWPDKVTLGFRAGLPSLELTLTVQSEADLPLRQEWETKLKTLLGAHIFGEGQDSLASVLVSILKDKRQTIAFAESCTGGLMAATLTAIPGASQVFEAGFVTYSNRIKSQILNVSAETLTSHGAVSEATVREMLQGLFEASNADFGVAVSGIAGPDGGSEEKPVGTVWFAWGSREEIHCQKLFYPLGRSLFQTIATAYGMDLARRFILGIKETPRYCRKKATAK